MKKYDGVIEAVRYTPEGKIQTVRVYSRFGPAWSDYFLLDRDGLIQRMQKGKRFVTGTRIPKMGSQFNFGSEVRLGGDKGNQSVMTGKQNSDSDHLEGVPLF